VIYVTRMEQSTSQKCCGGPRSKTAQIPESQEHCAGDDGIDS
jgi:hypothetical protein